MSSDMCLRERLDQRNDEDTQCEERGCEFVRVAKGIKSNGTKSNRRGPVTKCVKREGST